MGLRPTHYPFLESAPEVRSNFFEAVTENYLNTQGRPLEMLLMVRERFPVALHGVGLSIGSDKDPSREYLEKLKSLVQRVEPILVSDHLCWTEASLGNSHDLLPLPFTHEALNRVVQNIEITQNALGRTILVENISYYVRFKNDEMSEAQFIIETCRKSGARVLFDVNNIYVNSVNHGFDAADFCRSFPLDLIGQIHLAGPSQEEGFLFDTHSTKVPDQVWELFKILVSRGLKAPVLVEWDQNIPTFDELELEVARARLIINHNGASLDAETLT